MLNLVCRHLTATNESQPRTIKKACTENLGGMENVHHLYRTIKTEILAYGECKHWIRYDKSHEEAKLLTNRDEIMKRGRENVRIFRHIVKWIN